MTDETRGTEQNPFEDPCPPAADEFEGSVVEQPAVSGVEGQATGDRKPDAGDDPPLPPPVMSGVEGHHPLGPPQLRELLALACALHCDVRPRVLHYLAEHGPTCVGDLAAALAIDQKLLSNHLAKLKDKNLLDSTRQGRRVVYRLADGNATYRRENGEAHLVLSRGGGLKLTVTLEKPKAAPMGSACVRASGGGNPTPDRVAASEAH